MYYYIYIYLVLRCVFDYDLFLIYHDTPNQLKFKKFVMNYENLLFFNENIKYNIFTKLFTLLIIIIKYLKLNILKFPFFKIIYSNTVITNIY